MAGGGVRTVASAADAYLCVHGPTARENHGCLQTKFAVSSCRMRRVTFRLADNLSALDKIARHLGMFNQRFEPQRNRLADRSDEEIEARLAALDGADGTLP